MESREGLLAFGKALGLYFVGVVDEAMNDLEGR